MSVKPVVIVGAFVVLLATSATAAAGNGGFAPVPPESPNADAISQSYWFVTIFALGILVLVEGLLIVFVIRYRRRRRPRDADGAQIHGSNRLELAWTVAPVIILAAIGSFVFWKLPVVEDVPASAGGQENIVIEVVGTQFAWQYEYPNGVIAMDRMRAPLGRTVELHVTAPDWDVIHSWWIPQLGGKFDAIPGKVNRTWFQAERTGVFQGQCAELCGIYHAKMLASVEVLASDEFDRWLAEREEEQDAGASSQLGEELWDATCAKCHGLEGEGGYGPRIAGSDLLDDPEAIERLLREGLGQMPPVGRDWNVDQMEAITSYLEANVGG